MRQLQKEIISKLNVQPMIQPEEELRTRVDFIKDYLKKYPFIESLVLGISGGQDSTLAGRIAQIAINEMREETGNELYQFIAVRLPYGEQNDAEDAKKALEFIQADKTFVVNIKSSVDSLVNEFKENSALTIGDFNKGNIKARIRMVTQYGIAGEFKGAVLGTDHAAENVTGFFTKFGDGAADILPLSGLNKRQGRQLLQILGADESLYLKVPTADLEENKPMVADEVALGVTYEAIDDYLEGREVSESQAKTIEGWYLKTQHKRHLPITKDDTFWK
ncbi:ammonia-dependent NAD(+) synthetase [Vagococcus carniphilus]|uniref:ammonia-dependent NAD(+) synthetase n=1 Tax=Vagococcus carniphilus TaxID=218144 RepID=UPI00288F09FD|nr:ammonia-dependent NAD(+) synthetase [Vagococcus carniphilus]MDT2831838.1 ammonia-dependent NAD(+) synthetase [Vagococcus carniphilus]MDT2839354.1 ammonia-dependent NAD(+) synthetase [Vagococcus carniphilus]MDT2855348.1 ammonia-dependent NAD(+) synthetase [Vagococcus carniphilus]